jgi:hypothetical protein
MGIAQQPAECRLATRGQRNLNLGYVPGNNGLFLLHVAGFVAGKFVLEGLG